MLKTKNRRKCLKAEDGNVVGTDCLSPTLDTFWIWTDTGQLMNVKTLQCMQTQTGNKKKVQMKPCQKFSESQIVSCTVQSVQSHTMTIGWLTFWGTNKYLKLSGNYAISSSGRNPQEWRNDNKQLCRAEKPAYTGKTHMFHIGNTSGCVKTKRN